MRRGFPLYINNLARKKIYSSLDFFVDRPPPLAYYTHIETKETDMSNHYNEALLENLFEQFIAEGHDDNTAEALALDAFENLPEPDYN